MNQSRTILAMLVIFLFGSANISFAVDLGDFPAPFIQGNEMRGYLVVGDRASAEDIVGVSDIAVSLQYAISGGSGSGRSNFSVSGATWQVGTTSSQLEMAQNTDTFSGETIGDIRTTIDETELSLLTDGSITTEKGTSRYNQYLIFPSDNQSSYVIFAENDNDTASDFLYFRSGQGIGRYSLEFATSLQSDVEDSAGARTATGTYLGDYEDEIITIMGKEFNIVTARRTSATTNSIELTLMGGAVRDTLEEGETKTYTVEGKEYEVTATAITDTAPIYARFNINGESVRSLSDGETATLSDGTEIGVVDIVPNEAGDPTQDLVEFFVGASKLFLKDSDVTNTASSNALEVGTERVDDSAVIITGSNDNATFSIDTIQVNITADDDFYVGAGQKLSQFMDEPEALLGVWDIQYGGLASLGTETYRLRSSGSDQYDLVFVDGDGDSANLPLVYSNVSSQIKLGDRDDDLIVNGSLVISKNDYFVISYGGQQAGDRKTYAFRYRGADKVAAGETAQVRLQNLGTGDTSENTFRDNTGDTADATLKVGGSTFNIINASAATSNDFDIMVDLDGDGTTAGDTDIIPIDTNFGQTITFTVGTPTYLVVAFTTPNTNDYDNIAPAAVTMNITAASDREVSFAESSGSTINWISPTEEDNINYAYTSMGARYRWSNPSNDPDDLEVSYPRVQRLPLVYISGSNATTATVTSGETTTAGNRIEVGAVRLASEVQTPSAQNLIIVGGPCANTIAADLKNIGEDCTQGYEQGSSLIELVENGDNVALIVAGYNGADTRAASQAISNFDTSPLAGTRASVDTSSGQVTVLERGDIAAGGQVSGQNRTRTNQTTGTNNTTTANSSSAGNSSR
ncbi:MAG TPA: hypothetical protein VFF28_02615 [Candidatus Nanoarchaeia archaeon]|nr:hypothetical protein [Candidatus Nanoarchaeia archaeon]